MKNIYWIYSLLLLVSFPTLCSVSCDKQKVTYKDVEISSPFPMMPTHKGMYFPEQGFFYRGLWCY